MENIKKRLLTLVLAVAVVVTMLPANTYADVNKVSVYSKSDNAQVDIVGNVVNIDITKAIKQLASTFKSAGNTLKVKVSWFDDSAKEVTKTFSKTSKLAVTLDTSCKVTYTIELEPSYTSVGKTSYSYEYVIIAVDGQDGVPSEPSVSGGTSSSVSGDVNNNTNSSVSGGVNTNNSSDLGNGFSLLFRTEEPVYMEKGQVYNISATVTNAVKDIYFAVYSNTPVSMKENLTGLKSGKGTYSADKWYYSAKDNFYMLMTYANTNYKAGNLKVVFTPSQSGTYMFSCFVGDNTSSSESDYCYNLINTTQPTIKVATPKVSKIEALSETNYLAYVTNVATLEGLEYKVCKKGSSKAYKSGTSTMSMLNLNKLKASSVYSIQVRGYNYLNGKKVYSNWSKKKYFVSVPVLKKSQTKKTVTANGVNLQWKKVTGATNYIISYSKDGKKFTKLGETKKTNFKVNKNMLTLQYFRIIAVTKVNGKTVKSIPYNVTVSFYYHYY